jgi:hypothetical protein
MASLAPNESLCSLPRDRSESLAGDEFQLWWTTLRDLSQQLSDDVDSLGTALRLSECRRFSPTPRHGDNSNNRGDDSHRQCRSAAGDHGYVLVNPPDEIERRVHARSRDQQLSSTLVYSGQGSMVRNVAPSYRGGMLICEAPAMQYLSTCTRP